MAALQQQYPAGMQPGPGTGHPIFLPSNIVTRPSKFISVASHQPVAGQVLVLKLYLFSQLLCVDCLCVNHDLAVNVHIV